MDSLQLPTLLNEVLGGANLQQRQKGHKTVQEDLLVWATQEDSDQQIEESDYPTLLSWWGYISAHFWVPYNCWEVIYKDTGAKFHWAVSDATAGDNGHILRLGGSCWVLRKCFLWIMQGRNRLLMEVMGSPSLGGFMYGQIKPHLILSCVGNSPASSRCVINTSTILCGHFHLCCPAITGASWNDQ